jgi:hypothetical protein
MSANGDIPECRRSLTMLATELPSPSKRLSSDEAMIFAV